MKLFIFTINEKKCNEIIPNVFDREYFSVEYVVLAENEKDAWNKMYLKDKDGWEEYLLEKINSISVYDKFYLEKTINLEDPNIIKNGIIHVFEYIE